MDPKLTQYVVDSFSTENSLKKYTNDAKQGLWASEKLLVDEYFSKGSSVLDIGCGAGRTTVPLYDLGYKVTGVDITPKLIEIAQQNANETSKLINYQVGDATKLNYPNQFFDNVLFSFNGWSMIPSAEGRFEAAKEIFRVLKVGGHYIFCVHKRNFFGQELTWITQMIRLYILKPLGYKTKEMDYGDYYFRKDSETTYPIQQFVNFMNVEDVKKLHEQLGFKLELMKMRNEIAPEDEKLTSGDVMFFVFKK